MSTQQKYMFILVFIAFSLVSNVTQAQEFQRNALTVTSLTPNSAARIGNAIGTANFIFVNVNAGAWGTSTCHGSSVLLAESDRHLVSILLSAVSMGKTVNIGVEDTLKPYLTFCQIVYLDVSF